MDDLNKAFKDFLIEANDEVHGTTKRVVSNDSRVTVDTNKYRVPVQFVGKDVKIRKIYGFKLEIYDLNMNLINTHEILSGRDLVNAKDGHYDLIKSKAPKSIPEVNYYFNRNTKKYEPIDDSAVDFMTLEELYMEDDTIKISNEDSPEFGLNPQLDDIFKDIVVNLMKDKIQEISKYIHLEQSTKLVLISLKRLEENGYKVNLN